MSRNRYTHYPRTILWLVRGGTLATGSGRSGSEIDIGIDIEPFYLSKWPITNEQFEAFDPGFERAPISSGDRDTAVGISYSMAVQYAEWYAEVSRKAMRLPSEVEWEYACRGETSTVYFWGDDPDDGDEFVWDARTCSGRQALPPAEQTRPNEFGLHSMLGGVWEWTTRPYCADPHRQDAQDAQDAAKEEMGVLRGGSYRTPREELTCSARWASRLADCSHEVGFRIARSFR